MLYLPQVSGLCCSSLTEQHCHIVGRTELRRVNLCVGLAQLSERKATLKESGKSIEGWWKRMADSTSTSIINILVCYASPTLTKGADLFIPRRTSMVP